MKFTRQHGQNRGLLNGWIGVNDMHSPRFSLRGLGQPPGVRTARRTPPDTILPQGTWVIEAHMVAESAGSVPLLHLQEKAPWPRSLSLEIDEAGYLRLAISQGDTLVTARLQVQRAPIDSRIRVTLSWDAPRRRALLTAEDLGLSTLSQTEIVNPPPALLRDLARLCTGRDRGRFGPSVTLFALSDRTEPVGLMPGIAAGALIGTPSGDRLIETLKPGDPVLTATGTAMPIRWITRCDLPAAGTMAPVLLRAPYFGLQQDIRVAQDHRMMLSGIEAEYLFGSSDVLVEARQLLSTRGARLAAGPGLTRYHHILLDSHESIRVGGAWGESLYVGGIAATPWLAASTPLASMPPADIPHHRRIVRPVLRDYETVSLLSAMIA